MKNRYQSLTYVKDRTENIELYEYIFNSFKSCKADMILWQKQADRNVHLPWWT